ncbi:MAG: C-GCAxxG-C-C family protein [Spirochaetes bacterium]|nr:C-GCAxxG-C-C family protein [Spirochaetota bacterium]
MEGEKITHVEQALFHFRNNFNCAQSVFSTFGPLYGLDADTCLKIACPFGGGMARLGHVCGAVTGALMVIGLSHGKGVDDGEDCKNRTYTLVLEFIKRFQEHHGSIFCSELIGYNLSNPIEYERAKAENVFTVKCENYLIASVKILETMLAL